jgi:hypothetical protein
LENYILWSKMSLNCFLKILQTNQPNAQEQNPLENFSVLNFAMIPF